jgi:uncharacterized protein (TIGR03067 family)
MSDHAAIEGLWRQISAVTRGEAEVESAATHVLFEQDRFKRIYPSLVDGGEWATFALDPNSQPKRIVMTYESVGRNRKVERSVHRWLYELDGDALRLCWPSVFGHFPDAFCDEEHGVITLVRDPGPLPETKRASGKPPIDVPGLCALTWDDNLEWWQATFDLAPGKAVAIRLSFDAEPPHPETARIATELVEWLKANDLRARAFAAKENLDIYNDSWNDGGPITAGAFAKQVSLESAVRYPDGSIELYYEDGNLFFGHTIIVSVRPEGSFRSASIAG